MIDILLLMMIIEVLDSAWSWESHIWTSSALLHHWQTSLVPGDLVSFTVSVRDLSSSPTSLGLDFCRLMEGFPGSTEVKNPPANAGDARDVGSISGSGRFTGVENGTVVFLGKSHGLRSLVGHSPWVAKGWTWLKRLSSTHTAQTIDC